MKKLKLYKVLNKDLVSPFQKFPFEIGKTYHCLDFDEGDKECSSGFYATDIDGLPYAFNITRVIYEVEVWGKSKVFDVFKRRYEYMKVIKPVAMTKLIAKAKAEEQRLGYALSTLLNPVNPLILDAKVTDDHIRLLQEWASVRDSVRDSVGVSVRDSVGDSVRDSVWDSVGVSVRDSVGAYVRDSVWDSVGVSVRDSVGAYVSSLFSNIKKWKYVDHEEGKNPFQPCIVLWNAGLVPSCDGTKWRLHGKDAKTVFEITKEDLKNFK